MFKKTLIKSLSWFVLLSALFVISPAGAQEETPEQKRKSDLRKSVGNLLTVPTQGWGHIYGIGLSKTELRRSFGELLDGVVGQVIWGSKNMTCPFTEFYLVKNSGENTGQSCQGTEVKRWSPSEVARVKMSLVPLRIQSKVNTVCGATGIAHCANGTFHSIGVQNQPNSISAIFALQTEANHVCSINGGFLSLNNPSTFCGDPN